MTRLTMARKRVRHGDRAPMTPGALIATVVLAVGSVIMLLPLVFMISTALKSDAEVMVNPSLIPRDWQFNNFIKVWHAAPFGRFMLNSLFVTGVSLIGALCSNSLVAYGFAKIRFKGKNLIFMAVLGTMMIPSMVTMIPQYVMFSQFGWIGTYLPLLVPTFTASAYYIFLLRQFFMGIPMTYNEAARLDGANEMTIFTRIILPMAMPALMTVAVFEFNAKWNDYFAPMLYLTSEKQYTIQLGLRGFRGTAGTEWQNFMAASLIALLPVLILYICLQKHIIRSVAIGGIKG